MSATPHQIRANQQNSQLSTGPRTESGKQRSALNSTRHGFTGQVVALTAEEAEPYREFNEQILKDLAPANAIEHQLVRSIIDARWRMNQIASTESAIYAMGHREHADQFKDEPAELAAAMCRALTFKNNQRDLDRLRRYESALYRQATKDQATLAELQTERKAREAQQEKEAIQLLIHFKKLNADWDPTQFGFVWSTGEIRARQLQKLTLVRAQFPHGHYPDPLETSSLQ